MEKIILGLVIVLGLSFCMAFGVVATDENCPFPSRIHEGLQYQEPSQSQDSQDWLDISGGNLSYGMRSEPVKELQQILSEDKSIYPEGLTTGYFGELTQQAVKRFQEKQGLLQTGIVDQDFKNFLFPPKPIKPPEWPEAPELQIDDSISILPMPMPMPLNGCVQKCRSMGYSYGVCRSCAVYPGQKPCEEGEVSIGSTSDCSIEEVVDGGIVGIQVGIQKACCCGEGQTDICTDSDGGMNEYVKGKTCQPSRKISAIAEDTVSGSASLFCKTDRCLEAHTMGGTAPIEYSLIEYYCKDGVMMSKSFECENGCEDGACVKGDEPYCHAIGSRSEGWYQNGELIEWENCDGCSAVCKAIGTKSEGWYSSGRCETTGKLIKYDNCAEGMEGDVDLNGCVSLADSELIQSYLVGSKTLTSNQLKCADTNDDSVVTLKDSTTIKMWLEDSTYPLWQSPEDDDMAKPVACDITTDCVGDGEFRKLYSGEILGECCEGLHEIQTGGSQSQASLCTSAVCGNGKCETGETIGSCPQDCSCLSKGGTCINFLNECPTGYTTEGALGGWLCSSMSQKCCWPISVGAEPLPVAPVDVQPIITLIREAINKLNEAIKLLYALSGQQLTTQSSSGGSGSSSE